MGYKTYKLKKALGEKWINILKPLRYLYTKSDNFRKFIDDTEKKIDRYERKRYISKRIFWYLEEYGKCVIREGVSRESDYDEDIDLAYLSSHLRPFLLDNKWADKNKLKVVAMTYEQYIESGNIQKVRPISSWDKEDNVYIISFKERG